jgi:dTMP kinase
MKGKFVVIEGCDFTGKSTVIEKLAKTLRENGLEAFSAKALGETDYGIARRKFLMENKETLTNEEQVDLMIDAIQDVNKRKLKFQIEDGVFVVCDRYYYSTLVYQGICQNAIEMVEGKLSQANLIEPDLTIILDCETSVILQRMKERVETNSYDPKNKEEVDKIRNAYLQLSKRKNTTLIDTTNLTVEKIVAKITKKIRDI